MNKAIEIIQKRIDSLYLDLNITYMGDQYYELIQCRINELETLLDELKE